MSRPALAFGALGLLGVFGAYVATAAESALGGDGGELAALAVRGGVAHPPGYPLFVLYVRALAWLPARSPAHAASLATCLLGVLAAFLLYRNARVFGASARSAALVTAIYAASPLTWKLSTYPEVFAGNVCIALAITWLSRPPPSGPCSRGEVRVGLLCALAGLGFSHHHSIVLLAPLGLFAVYRALREAEQKAVALAFAALGLTLGLSPYLYVWLAGRGSLGQGVLLWGDTSTLAGLWAHFTRSDYGTFNLGSQARERDVALQLLFLLRTHGRDFLALPALVVGALVAARSRVLGGDGRRERALLLASALLAGPVFVASFNVPPRAIGAEIVERFHLLPAALSLVFVAPAFDVALEKLKAPIAALAVLLVAAVGASLALPAIAVHHRPTVQRYAENVFRFVEPNAVVIGSGDHRAGSFRYAQARGLREDVTYLEPWLLLSDATRTRMDRRLGLSLPAPRREALGARVVDAHAVLTALVSSGRPVYVCDWPAPGLERQFPNHPVGPLLRLVSTPSDVLAPPAVLALNERVFSEMTLDAEPPPRASWGGALYGDYMRPWTALAHAFRASGDTRTAELMTARAAALLPR